MKLSFKSLLTGKIYAINSSCFCFNCSQKCVIYDKSLLMNDDNAIKMNHLGDCVSLNPLAKREWTLSANRFSRCDGRWLITTIFHEWTFVFVLENLRNGRERWGSSKSLLFLKFKTRRKSITCLRFQFICRKEFLRIFECCLDKRIRKKSFSIFLSSKTTLGVSVTLMRGGEVLMWIEELSWITVDLLLSKTHQQRYHHLYECCWRVSYQMIAYCWCEWRLWLCVENGLKWFCNKFN